MTTELGLALTTALIAVVSAGLSVLVGIPFGNWLASLSEKNQRIVGSITVVPFLLPPLLIGLAALPITSDLEINSVNGILLIVLAHAFMNVGFIGRVVAGATTEKYQVEAARLDGAAEKQIVNLIQLPQQLPSIASAALLVALYSATSFGLVLLIGAGSVDTLETEIAIAALQQLDLQRAGLLAILQTALTVIFFLAARRFPNAGFQLDQVWKSSLQSTPIQKLAGFGYLATVVFALFQVVLRAVDHPLFLGNFFNLATRGTRSLLNISVIEAAANSLRNMVVVLAISMVVAFWLAGRKRGSLLVLLPVGISPVVLGLGALVLSGYLPRAVSSSWLIVPVVQSVIAIALAYQILRPARLSFDQELLDAASLDGAGTWSRLARVELPLLRKPLGVATAFVGMSSLGEFGAASFLAFGSQETLPIVMFRLASRPGSENYGMAMAVGVIYILLTAWIVWLSSRPSRIQRQAD